MRKPFTACSSLDVECPLHAHVSLDQAPGLLCWGGTWTFRARAFREVLRSLDMCPRRGWGDEGLFLFLLLLLICEQFAPAHLPCHCSPSPIKGPKEWIGPVSAWNIQNCEPQLPSSLYEFIVIDISWQWSEDNTPPDKMTTCTQLVTLRNKPVGLQEGRGGSMVRATHLSEIEK